MTTERERETILVTGFPAFSAKEMIAVLAAPRVDAVLILARRRFSRPANEFATALGEHVQVIEGDVCDMDLGLSGQEFSDLANRVTTIHHLAAIYYHGVDKQTTLQVNIEGSRGIIAFARECRHLRRLIHWSTAFVSGKRKGVVLEEDLDDSRGFNNYWEESKFRAERLARDAQRTLPVTVVRPSIIIGHSESGRIDEFEGPHSPIMSAIRGGKGLRLPLPARSTAPLHVVPIDFVTRAAAILGRDQRAAGGTFHLTDNNPLPAKRIFELVSELASRRAPPAMVSPSLVRTLLRTPGLERITRAPRAVLDSLDHQCLYNSRNATRILADHDLACPVFDDYAEAIVSFALQTRTRTSQEPDADDPLA